MIDPQIAPRATLPASIVQASEASDCYQAALAYQQLNLSTLPLKGKRPALTTWSQYQFAPASAEDITAWQRAGLFGNVGLICGRASDNLIILDFDGAGGYPAFAATFPHLAETFTVATGGGIGRHIYLRADQIPPTTKAMNTPIGHVELRAGGAYAVAPPSIHPDTCQPYRVEKPLDILRVPDLDDVATWIAAFNPATREPRGWQPPRDLPTGEGEVNPQVIEAITTTLHSRGFKTQREWLNGPCIFPERHKNGDRHPSFGFHTHSGYGFCYVCGSIRTKDLCERLSINPHDYGGLMQPAGPVVTPTSQPRDRRVAPAAQPVSPPPPHSNLPPLSEIRLPNWLSQYVGWSSRVGNQTPLMFHQAAGIWLLAVAIARRLYVEAPWGIRLYPNLYMMFVADTTFYRKTTAYKLAESIIRGAIPHMLMPTPGSPERFQDALAGRPPSNYKELTYAQQELLSKARSFAAQRGLFKDEVAGLFGAFNKKDYMVGLKDLIMELYDCPDYSDKDTQTGLTIVKDAALSILGVTTPAGLSAAINPTDWDNGLLPRFLMLTPEPDYQERPTLQAYEPAPAGIAAGLKALYERLPMPEQEGDGWKSPAALKVEAHCWDEVQAYSSRLREMCDPHHETPLDDRLKGLYGRMHVQGLKLATILAALDWLERGEDAAPVISRDNWVLAETISEHWRHSAHRLLDHLDRSGAGREERRQQDRVLDAVRGAGPSGITLRRMYRNLNLRSADARQMVQELVRDGQIVLQMFGSAEGCLAAEYVGAN